MYIDVSINHNQFPLEYLTIECLENRSTDNNKHSKNESILSWAYIIPTYTTTTTTTTSNNSYISKTITKTAKYSELKHCDINLGQTWL